MKAKRRTWVALFIVLPAITTVVASIVIYGKRPSDAVRLAPLAATTEQGLAIFAATNQTEHVIDYWIIVESKMSNGWIATVPPVGTVLGKEDRQRLAPKSSALIRVEAPPTADGWRVALICVTESGNAVVSKMADLLEAWGLNRLAGKLPKRHKDFTVYGPEMSGKRGGSTH